MTTGHTSEESGRTHDEAGSLQAGGSTRMQGAVPRGSSEHETSGTNFGSARSDYGRNAYGGRLDSQGLESSNTLGRFFTRRSSSQSSRASSGGGASSAASAGLLFLSGVGLGAALMYILDPERGRTRRALVRDKVISAGNQTRQALNTTARDIGNRARGTVAEVSSTVSNTVSGALSSVGLTSGTNESQQQEQNTTASSSTTT